MSEPRHPVVNQFERSRNEVLAGGGAAESAEYRLRGDRIFFVHTEMTAEYAGQGFDTTLAGAHLRWRTPGA